MGRYKVSGLANYKSCILYPNAGYLAEYLQIEILQRGYKPHCTSQYLNKKLLINFQCLHYLHGDNESCLPRKLRKDQNKLFLQFFYTTD